METFIRPQDAVTSTMSAEVREYVAWRMNGIGDGWQEQAWENAMERVLEAVDDMIATQREEEGERRWI